MGPTPAEILAARAWARRCLGYLPPGWDDDAYVAQPQSSMARWFRTSVGAFVAASVANAPPAQSQAPVPSSPTENRG